ncbi:TMEM175 family protein [Roseomonas sp. CAU 1739]|uniref:TMEM175 family protein n=1 Tax=Roseomonas sp. CAU 1739 TaxID=3140364 RepID=UPI00325BA8E6
MAEHGVEGSIPTARLDALTDGVIAIAITLLVLELRVPEGIGHLDGDALFGLLADMRHQFAGYVVSFVVVGTLWLRHVQILRGSQPADGTTVWMTLGFLGAVAMVPFTTALLSRNHGVAATAVYGASMAVASLLLSLMARRRRPRSREPGLLVQFAIPALFVASIGLAFWNPMAARLSWLLILPISLFATGNPRRPDSA